ncbi:sugar kinase, partial [bacterium]|nr:sugar kinase [bacterium]
MSILVVGTAAYDALKSPFGEVERALGGSAVYFALAACNFSHVSICAVVGKDFEAADLELLEHKGVDISGVERSNGETFFWKGEYHEDLNTAHTKETRLGVLADFDPQISDE